MEEQVEGRVQIKDSVKKPSKRHTQEEEDMSLNYCTHVQTNHVLTYRLTMMSLNIKRSIRMIGLRGSSAVA